MTKYQRALQIWSILICAARERKSYTYGEIARILGVGRADFIGTYLGPIMYHCDEVGYPALTVLVVRKDTGCPGEGLITVSEDELDIERERVFKFNWFALEPPQIEDFEETDQA
ncbi:hypothetical protein [Halodesulfovibrio marinisediminis]|uniref:Uncharacterized protein n=1 Tax=Halodesulfovibrio marinisediminis DSM 17456 TaxID=1121457 RepID=A0A1N6DPG3_9BACT|nr:hypothetical protein [Halodesulfovibrio marinisediminis]SIN72553.1 hypothetical protein SAMN02745161_0360 [Halodesulfovibrio marinisediminis DSM 17456]